MSPRPLVQRTADPDKAEHGRKASTSTASDVSVKDEPSGSAERGRPRARAAAGDEADAEHGAGADDGELTKSGRKRKRSRKGLDKKYLCPHKGCGKSYSRAEHLYRHQLNHNPKQIYRCDFPNCMREFVRQDLCVRHRERHTARGSVLQRKDSYIDNSNNNNNMDVGNGQAYQDSSSPHQLYQNGGNDAANPAQTVPPGPYIQASAYPGRPLQSPLIASIQSLHGHAAPAGGMLSPSSYQEPPQPQSQMPYPGSFRRSNSDGQYYPDQPAGPFEAAKPRTSSMSTFDPGQRPSGFRPMTPGSAYPQYSGMSGASGQGPDSPQQARFYVPHQSTMSHSGMNPSNGNGSYNGYIPTNQFQSVSSLPPPVVSPPSATAYQQRQQQQGYHQPVQEMGQLRMTTDEILQAGASDSPLTDGSIPIFDAEGLSRSPVAMTDDFTAWLFSQSSASTMHTRHRHGSMSIDPSLAMSLNTHAPGTTPDNWMAVTSLLGNNGSNILSLEKYGQLVKLVETRFSENSYAPVSKSKAQLLHGNREEKSHVLSYASMRTYIGSYWYHFHDQMPILHQATFVADNAQDLLLIAIIAIGAANLDRIHGTEFTDAAEELAGFLAWHLRGEIFNHIDFRPPAKLWILQALLLLEVYEKLFSSRVLHERAQIHHATTIALLRRGSALLGRSALDSPPVANDEKSSIVDTPDPWWNRWITNEATRRLAFAAFILDSTHATMFAHTAQMVAHEMRLPLPCDEKLWQATSGPQVASMEKELLVKGFKPISFLEGLKWTLNGKPVRTHTFGRTALMAGLLNVSFHLGQRDLQIRSLGNIGGQEVWRGTLTKAFDIWERDWDHDPDSQRGSISKDHSNGSNNQTGMEDVYPTPRFVFDPSNPSAEQENVFESRVVLHHLAHMGMHVDIVQCQIFARAKRLLGRSIMENDYQNTCRRMKDVWAPKAAARDAVFFSLRFLQQVLTPDLYGGAADPSSVEAAAAVGPQSRNSAANIHADDDDDVPYSPRDDYLLNRPWVLYFSALVVWSYGFALEGPINPSTAPPLETNEEQVLDMRKYLGRVGAVAKPDDLAKMESRNHCRGLLMVLSRKFKGCRWELLHEAGRLLDNCVTILMGRAVPRGSSNGGPV